MLGFIIGFPVCALIMFVSMKIQKLINKWNRGGIGYVWYYWVCRPT
jgi:hypothetical protein